MHNASQEDLDALNQLVQDGFIEVVRVDDGEPSYCISTKFTVESPDEARSDRG